MKKRYEIRITGTGPASTGNPSTDADLLVQPPKSPRKKKGGAAGEELPQPGNDTPSPANPPQVPSNGAPQEGMSPEEEDETEEDTGNSES